MKRVAKHVLAVKAMNFMITRDCAPSLCALKGALLFSDESDVVQTLILLWNFRLNSLQMTFTRNDFEECGVRMK